MEIWLFCSAWSKSDCFVVEIFCG